MTEGKIFISYSRKDSKIMRQVREHLEQAGVSVWTDEGLRPSTKDWQIAIEREIEACDAMVVLLSQDACDPKWVRREINRADRLERLVLPLVVKRLKKATYLAVNYHFMSVYEFFLVGCGI